MKNLITRIFILLVGSMSFSDAQTLDLNSLRIAQKQAAKFKNTDFKIFGKPNTRKYRRMAVALAFGKEDTPILVQKAKEVATKIKVN